MVRLFYVGISHMVLLAVTGGIPLLLRAQHLWL
jgi:hypothetical protein